MTPFKTEISSNFGGYFRERPIFQTEAERHGRRHRGGCRGHVPPVRNSGGEAPSEIAIFKENFYEYLSKFSDFSMFSKQSGRNLKRNRNLGVGDFDSPEFVPPPSRNLSPNALLVVPMPHIKFQCNPSIHSRDTKKRCARAHVQLCPTINFCKTWLMGL